MKLRSYDPTILAIELRHRQFGYSVYQGHLQLLDWGVRVYPAVGELEAAMVGKRLIGLLRLFSPNVIVVKTERWDRANINVNMRGVVDAVKQEAFTHAIRILAVTEENVRRTFHKFRCETKDQIAAVLAGIFPELVWHLPPKRHPWQSEHRRTVMFDAIALGLAYWQHPNTEIPNSPG